MNINICTIGIHRSIEIVRRPARADIVDFQIQADANGHFECCVEYRTVPRSLLPKQKEEANTHMVNVQKERNHNQQIVSEPKVTSTCRKQILVARIYSDKQLSADGDIWEPGTCIWETNRSIDTEPYCNSEGKHHPQLGAKSNSSTTAKINFADTLSNVQLWSAEIPNLYTLTVTLYEVVCHQKDDPTVGKEKWTCHQSESCRVGFRTIDIVSPGVVYINHCRVTAFAGMNRHEHDPDHGKVVSVATMQQDLCLLKYVYVTDSLLLILVGILDEKNNDSRSHFYSSRICSMQAKQL
jgi:Glycosyl hydrolases family 2, TIM barrel domain/Glycosyl hydrolases family 2